MAAQNSRSSPTPGGSMLQRDPRERVPPRLDPAADGGSGVSAVMALSPLHQALFAVSLGLCVFVVLPRFFGGARESPGRLAPYERARGNVGSGRQNLGHQEGKSYENMRQVRHALAQNIKNERTNGNHKGFTFTLMPLFAIGVGVFAAYKFVKIKSKEEESTSRKAKNEEDMKTKETEHQLLELEQRLAQTETMLNSLLSQLDPLSNCVNVLANDQRDEIMTQLQSIRQLMKENDINKSELNHEGESGSSKDKLKDLIHSLEEHCQEPALNDKHQTCSDYEEVSPETDEDRYRTSDDEDDDKELLLRHEADSEHGQDRVANQEDASNLKLPRLRRRNRKD
uniref:Uncharacterized protein LOC117363631 n=1 Tax=Geotrypetes seraphini TaxID=260995 RepID=A0A6P8RRM5_GEOSA|nr:uncharacterized protein LOC117363631 [Geotrypetes seraphini]